MTRRTGYLILILLVGAGMTALLVIEKPQAPLKATFAPAFQLLGRTTKAFDRTLSRTVLVNDIDERRFAEAVILRYQDERHSSDRNSLYLNDLMKHISRFAKKPFEYRILVMHTQTPNAIALPGGVIFVTDGLLSVMKSEAEFISVLAHEMGHIEHSHCLDAVKFELATRKIGSASLGMLADLTVGLMLRDSFSKTQEDEADEYAYELVLNTEYDPSAVASSFARLLEYEKGSGAPARDPQASVIRDYLATHPPMVLRQAKFSEMAKQWWKRHGAERRYVGEENLRQRIASHKNRIDKEWVLGR